MQNHLSESAKKYNLLGEDAQIYRIGRTDYLVTRELPAILSKYNVSSILDLGCGAGLSTRFLKKLGYECIGVDSSDDMLTLAKQNDPTGIYKKSISPTLLPFDSESFEMAVSVFVLFEIATMDLMISLFKESISFFRETTSLFTLEKAPATFLSS